MLVNRLVEIALAVEDAHRNKRNAQVTGGLAVVACQYAKATRVDGKTFMETKFCAEVGNQVIVGIDIFTDAAVHALLVVGVIGRKHPLKIFHEDAVIGGGLKALLRYPSQKGFRVVTGTAPEVLVKPGKHAPDLPVPAVNEIAGKLFQSYQCCRDAWLYFERKACT